MPRRLDDALLAFWRLTERFEGLPPTVREVQEEMSLSSTSVAARWLNRLEESGLIYCPGALKSLPYRTSRNRQLTSAGMALALKGQRGTASALYGHEAQGRGR